MCKLCYMTFIYGLASAFYLFPLKTLENDIIQCKNEIKMNIVTNFTGITGHRSKNVANMTPQRRPNHIKNTKLIKVKIYIANNSLGLLVQVRL